MHQLEAELPREEQPVVGGSQAGRTDLTHLGLDIYAPDTRADLAGLTQALGQADYVVLASQRLYGVTGRLPDRYPLAAAYYRLLFAGQLGFQLVHVETSYPQLGPLAIVDEPLAGTVLPRPRLPRPAPLVLDLGRADESYAVYDHPRVLIFQKVEALSPGEMAARIDAAAADGGASFANRSLFAYTEVNGL